MLNFPNIENNEFPPMFSTTAPISASLAGTSSSDYAAFVTPSSQSYLSGQTSDISKYNSTSNKNVPKSDYLNHHHNNNNNNTMNLTTDISTNNNSQIGVNNNNNNVIIGGGLDSDSSYLMQNKNTENVKRFSVNNLLQLAGGSNRRPGNII